MNYLTISPVCLHLDSFLLVLSWNLNFFGAHSASLGNVFLIERRFSMAGKSSQAGLCGLTIDNFTNFFLGGEGTVLLI